MAKSRPIVTIYDDGRVAHSSTKQRAVQAAAKRLLAGDYWHAQVNEYGRTVAVLVNISNRSMTVTLSRRYWK